MSTLDLLLSSAVVNGLRQLNVTRIGIGTIQWQASARWHGRDGYAVAIRDTPEEAATEALTSHPLPSTPMTETPHAYAAVDAPDPDMAAVATADALAENAVSDEMAAAAYRPPLGSLADDWDDVPNPKDEADDLDGW